MKNKRLGPNGNQNKIVSSIKQNIINGNYKPNQKLPSRLELEKKYKSSRMTIQKAFDKLKKDGFIKSCGSKGTLVVEHPPCFSNYAVVFQYHVGIEHTERSFYNILRNEIQKSNKDGYTFTIYHGLNGHTDEPDYIRLYEDIKDKKLAGVIFTVKPYLLYDTPLFKDILADENVAKVASSPPNQFPELPVIGNDIDAVCINILNFLKNEGVRKLAVVDLQENLKKGVETSLKRSLVKHIKNYGIDLPRCNFQVRHPDLNERADDLVEMMFNCKEEQRPDALWIGNDALVEAATRGIVTSGIRVPKDMIVISHCNFPGKPHSNVETSWYGLDVYKFIDLALSVMNKQHKGEPFEQNNIIHNDYQFISSKS